MKSCWRTGSSGLPSSLFTSRSSRPASGSAARSCTPYSACSACKEWMEAETSERRADLYLLLDVDVPGFADGARDSGARRDELHEEFRRALEEFGAKYVLISGTWKERRKRAIEAVRGAGRANDGRLR